MQTTYIVSRRLGPEWTMLMHTAERERTFRFALSHSPALQSMPEGVILEVQKMERCVRTRTWSLVEVRALHAA